MKIFKPLDAFTAAILTAGLLLISYGYLARLLDLYFFWESKLVGWVLLFIAILGFLSGRTKAKTIQNRKAVVEKIAMGVIGGLLLIKTAQLAVLPYADAYSAAKTYLSHNPRVISELGTVTGFGLIPTGSIEEITDPSGDYGYAEINLTVKGDKKFKDLTLYVVKFAESPEWQVEGIE